MMISPYTQRVIFSDNGVLKDITINANDFMGGNEVIPITALEDAIYIGTDWPFLQRFLKLSTKNTNNINLTIEFWDDGWKPVNTLFDETSGLTKDGLIRFDLLDDDNWNSEYYSYDITGLETTKDSFEIYNFYWLRVKFSGDLSALTALDYCGFKFSDDNHLFSKYPDLDNTNLMSKFKAGQTDWETQTLIASSDLIAILKKRNTISNENQLLDWDLFRDANIHKTAEIIYGGMGKHFAEDRNNAHIAFNSAIKFNRPRIDKNKNARLDTQEKENRTGFMTR